MARLRKRLEERGETAAADAADAFAAELGAAERALADALESPSAPACASARPRCGAGSPARWAATAMARKGTSLGAEADFLRIACFVLYVALLLHVRDAAATPFSARGAAPWRKFLRGAWRKMGPAPVVPLASAVLGALPDGAASELLLGRLAQAAQATARSGVLARHDFLGRIYRKLLLGAAGPHYASYYTSVPAARLLADLTLGAPAPAPREEISVIDPACGSGTLLAAAHAALDDARVADARLCGWDVMAFAVEVARATLALAAGPARQERADLRALLVGVTKGKVRLGSLDHLRHGVPPRRRHDFVLMNPPFSRSAKPNLTFGYSAVGRAPPDAGSAHRPRAVLGPFRHRPRRARPLFHAVGARASQGARAHRPRPAALDAVGRVVEEDPRALSRGVRDQIHRREFRCRRARRRAVELEREHGDRRGPDRRRADGKAGGGAHHRVRQCRAQAAQR